MLAALRGRPDAAAHAAAEAQGLPQPVPGRVPGRERRRPRRGSSRTAARSARRRSPRRAPCGARSRSRCSARASSSVALTVSAHRFSGQRRREDRGRGRLRQPAVTRWSAGAGGRACPPAPAAVTVDFARPPGHRLRRIRSAQRIPVGSDHTGPAEEDPLHPRDPRGLPPRGGASRRRASPTPTCRSASRRSGRRQRGHLLADQPVLRRRAAAAVGVRAGHHALHHREHHRAAAHRGHPAVRAAEEGGPGRPGQADPVHPLPDDRAGHPAGHRHRGARRPRAALQRLHAAGHPGLQRSSRWSSSCW